MRRPIRMAIVLAWLALMAVLVFREVFPGLFTAASAGYEKLLADAPLIGDSWMRILVNGEPAGFSHTTISQAPDRRVETFRLENRTLLTLNVLGQPTRVSVAAGAVLDQSSRLQRFSFGLLARPYRATVEARRDGDDFFDVTIETAAGRQHTRVRVPDDAVLYSPMTEMLLGSLKPGRTLRLKTLDPVSMTPGDVLVHAVRRESITVGGRAEDATLLEVSYRGLEVRSWVAPDGRMLRQETPFGWTLEACNAQQALAAARGAGEGAELLASAAVPCRGTIPDPRTCTALRLRLSGAPALQALDLASDRQRVEGRGEDAVVLDLRVSPPPAVAPPPPDAARWLQPSAFVQSTNTEIVALAAQLTAPAATPREAAEAIGDWVFRNVRKNPTVSLPSALDVLRTREGDCNEHTYLAVALARAAGLPAKILVGIVYSEGAFYYHAWPAIYAGGWLELDPTFGQPRADATHVALTEGELDAQMALLGLVGRLRAEVLPLTGEGDTE